MNFFDPQVSLYKYIYIDGDSQYFLHVITFTDNSAIQAESITVDDSVASTEKIIHINTAASVNNNAVAIECIQPISHTIALGNMPYGEDMTFKVSLKVEGSEEMYLSSRPKPKPVILSRPIGEDTVEATWVECFGTQLGN